jgi:hypothetical protein
LKTVLLILHKEVPNARYSRYKSRYAAFIGTIRIITT